jgi:uncharacterized protein
VQLRQFDDAAAFYEQVESYLLAREAEHCVILGICSTLMKTNMYREPPYLAYVEDAGMIVGVAIRTPPYNVLLANMLDDRVTALIAEDVRKVYDDNLIGVIGPRAESKAFAEVWSGMTGQWHHLNIAERLYRLDTVNPVIDVNGEMRLPGREHRELLIQWLIEFSNEALDGISREDAERDVDMRFDADPSMRGHRIWCDGGKPVSYVGYGGPTPNGIRIGPVYTPPALRGMGYASACTAALSQHLLDGGRKFCFLFTDLSNPTSNHIYQNIGYGPVSDVDAYRFGGTE